MRLGGGEVVVHGQNVPRLHEGFGQQVLGGAALVDRHHVPVAEDLGYRSLQPIEALRPGVRVVGLHHGSQLVVGHRIRAAVRQHVQENVAAAKLEGVVPSFFNRPEPVADRRQARLLHNAHLVHFDGNFRTV